jgi:hypothetical protein
MGDLTSKYNLTVPSESGTDMAYGILKAAVSAVPLAGGPLAELLGTFLGPPIERRREEWMRRVAQVLNTLATNSVSIESLQNDERFVSAFIQALLIAQRTHSREKLDALRNALLNTAIASSPDEALESIFFGFIDAFTEWHIRILRLYQQPSANGMMTELYEIVEAAYPQLKGRREIYDTIWQDLLGRGLVNMQSLHGKIGNLTTIIGRRTTELGDKFLQFIAEPGWLR